MIVMTITTFKQVLSATVLLLAGASICQGVVTLDYTGAPLERNVTVSTGAPVPDGNEVRAGYFDVGFDIAANVAGMDLMALGGAWNQFDVALTTQISGEPGRFAASGSLTDPTFDGQQIYLWILMTDTNGAVASDFSNVEEFGIFTSTAPNWVFPVEGSPIPTTLVTTSEVTQAFAGSIVAGTPGSLQLVAIPEPGQAALVVLGIFGLLWAPRRKG